MAPVDRVSMTVGVHGHFETSAEGFDYVLGRYLPASVGELRSIICERSPGIDYSDLIAVSQCLMILAELDGFATN